MTIQNVLPSWRSQPIVRYLLEVVEAAPLVKRIRHEHRIVVNTRFRDAIRPQKLDVELAIVPCPFQLGNLEETADVRMQDKFFRYYIYSIRTEAQAKE